MRSHGGGKTSGSSWGVWGRRNCPYDAPESGVLSPLRCCRTVIFQKPTAESLTGGGGPRRLDRQQAPLNVGGIGSSARNGTPTLGGAPASRKTSLASEAWRTLP